MLAKYFNESPAATPEDREVLVPRLQSKAQRAYDYAVAMFARDGLDSSCTRSAANTQCIGGACSGEDSVRSTLHSVCVGTLPCAVTRPQSCLITAHGLPRCPGQNMRDGVQPCELYKNHKSPQQQLFTASAALFALTGLPAYRTAADSFWDPGAYLFFSNWNNVWLQVRTPASTGCCHQGRLVAQHSICSLPSSPTAGYALTTRRLGSHAPSSRRHCRASVFW